MDKLKKIAWKLYRAGLRGLNRSQRIESAIQKIEGRTTRMHRQVDIIQRATSRTHDVNELIKYYSLLCELGREPGVRSEERSPALTVSMTTIPSRLQTVHLTIESLLRQSIQPDRFILWLDHESFDGIELPVVLQRQRERGLQIRYCDNLRSYKKLIPALEQYPDDIIVTSDDDVFYPREWLNKLYQAHCSDPQTVHCHRCHRILFDGTDIKPYQQWEYEANDFHERSYFTFPTGVGGVLYPPGALPNETLDTSQFMKLAPSADDVWFKAMSIKNGVLSHLVEKNALLTKDSIWQNIYEIPGTQEVALYKSNYFGNENDVQIKQTFQAHGIFERLLAAKSEPRCA